MSATATAPGGRVKVRLGAKIRRLRRDHRMNQAQLAERLGISASYLNLIEHNHRNVTVGLLLKLAEVFQLNINELAEDDESQLVSNLMEAFDDTLFEEIDLTNVEIRELVGAAPVAAKAILALYDAYRTHQTDMRSLADQLSDEAGALLDFESRMPADLVSDFIQSAGNYFPDIEEEADRVRQEAKFDRQNPIASMTAYLQDAFGVRVVVLPPAPGFETMRRYDSTSRVLEISEMLPRSSRIFQLAHQIGLLSISPVFDTLLIEGGVKSAEARRLGRISLANYFAAALMMPYDDFLGMAEGLRYDIELLQHHYNANFEQVCHRLTTLHKPTARGIPFHMLRVDIAGNISKRFSASGLRIPRHGGACPRWNVYTAFLTPDVIHAQISRMGDGNGYFCIARTLQKRGGGHGSPQSILSIGLGCELSRARELVYSDGIDLDNPERAVPAGVQCRACERMDCSQRAFPPVHHKLDMNENTRGLSAYVSPPSR